jgi:hypothetical protein
MDSEDLVVRTVPAFCQKHFGHETDGAIRQWDVYPTEMYVNCLSVLKLRTVRKWTGRSP